MLGAGAHGGGLQLVTVCPASESCQTWRVRAFARSRVPVFPLSRVPVLLSAHSRFAPDGHGCGTGSCIGTDPNLKSLDTRSGGMFDSTTFTIGDGEFEIACLEQSRMCITRDCFVFVRAYRTSRRLAHETWPSSARPCA